MGTTVAEVGTAVEASQGFLQILGDLSGSRSAMLQVDNRTKMTLKLLRHSSEHGGIHELPPDEIPPGAGIFSAQSTGLFTGVQGSATFAASGFDVTVSWNVPFIGENHARTDLNGELAAHYAGSAIWGVGNTQVRMRFDVKANVLDYATISEKYQALLAGGLSLGNSIGSEAANSDNVGRRQEYEHGVIYWSPTTTAHEVHGAILAKWTELGREAYGYPTSDEMDVVGGGKVSHFQLLVGGGQVFRASIYWSPATGVHEVRGAIREAWWSHGGPGGFLGYPTSDEQDLPGVGRLSVFEHGSISWSPTAGIGVIPA